MNIRANHIESIDNPSRDQEKFGKYILSFAHNIDAYRKVILQR